MDNGIATHDGEPRYKVTTTLGCRVADLKPAWNAEVQDFDAGFNKAMELVRPEFLDRINFYANIWWPARALVAQALEDRFKVRFFCVFELLEPFWFREGLLEYLLLIKKVACLAVVRCHLW